jgi:hypothetical protein
MQGNRREIEGEGEKETEAETETEKRPFSSHLSFSFMPFLYSPLSFFLLL